MAREAGEAAFRTAFTRVGERRRMKRHGRCKVKRWEGGCWEDMGLGPVEVTDARTLRTVLWSLWHLYSISCKSQIGSHAASFKFNCKLIMQITVNFDSHVTSNRSVLNLL